MAEKRPERMIPHARRVEIGDLQRVEAQRMTMLCCRMVVMAAWIRNWAFRQSQVRSGDEFNLALCCDRFLVMGVMYNPI